MEKWKKIGEGAVRERTPFSLNIRFYVYACPLNVYLCVCVLMYRSLARRVLEGAIFVLHTNRRVRAVIRLGCARGLFIIAHTHILYGYIYSVVVVVVVAKCCISRLRKDKHIRRKTAHGFSWFFPRPSPAFVWRISSSLVCVRLCFFFIVRTYFYSVCVWKSPENKCR